MTAACGHNSSRHTPRGWARRGDRRAGEQASLRHRTCTGLQRHTVRVNRWVRPWRRQHGPWPWPGLHECWPCKPHQCCSPVRADLVALEVQFLDHLALRQGRGQRGRAAALPPHTPKGAVQWPAAQPAQPAGKISWPGGAGTLARATGRGHRAHRKQGSAPPPKLAPIFFPQLRSTLVQSLRSNPRPCSPTCTSSCSPAQQGPRIMDHPHVQMFRCAGSNTPPPPSPSTGTPARGVGGPRARRHWPRRHDLPSSGAVRMRATLGLVPMRRPNFGGQNMRRTFSRRCRC